WRSISSRMAWCSEVTSFWKCSSRSLNSASSRRIRSRSPTCLSFGSATPGAYRAAVCSASLRCFTPQGLDALAHRLGVFLPDVLDRPGLGVEGVHLGPELLEFRADMPQAGPDHVDVRCRGHRVGPPVLPVVRRPGP